MPTIKANIIDDSVTFAKIQNINTSRVLGRSSASTGDIEELTIGSGITLISGELDAYDGGRMPSWDNPPASAGTYDDEFNTGSLGGAWTLSSTGTTNAVTTGTINYFSNLTTPIVDLTTNNSHIFFQSDNSSLQTVQIVRSYTASTNETWFMKQAFSVPTSLANGAKVDYRLYNSGSPTDYIQFGFANVAGEAGARIEVSNAGVVSGTTGGGHAVRGPENAHFYLAMWKKSNVYYLGYGMNPGPVMIYVGSVTKTGTTTLDEMKMIFTTSSTTPSAVVGVDFIRYKSSLDYSLVNP